MESVRASLVAMESVRAVLQTTGERVGAYTLRVLGTVAGVGVAILVLRPVRQAVYARLHGRSRNIYRDKMEKRKQQLFDTLAERGREKADDRPLSIVYLGTSICENMRHLPVDAEITCITSDVYRKKDVRRIQEEAPRVKVVPCPVTAMAEVADGSADVVVCMLTLCTVERPEAAIKEILRVLKPGGMLIFMEHVVAKKLSVTSRLQKRYALWWGMMLYGCKLNRKPWKQLTDSLSDVTYERFHADVDLGAQRFVGQRLGGWLNGFMEYMIGPHVMGTARKPSAAT